MCFIRFPQDESKKLTWAKVMGLQMECLPKSSHLCSLHFSDDDFDRSSLTRIRLRENAIPIVNIVLFELYYFIYVNIILFEKFIRDHIIDIFKLSKNH